VRYCSSLIIVARKPRPRLWRAHYGLHGRLAMSQMTLGALPSCINASCAGDAQASCEGGSIMNDGAFPKRNFAIQRRPGFGRFECRR
jgi:hypothetical protein